MSYRQSFVPSNSRFNIFTNKGHSGNQQNIHFKFKLKKPRSTMEKKTIRLTWRDLFANRMYRRGLFAGVFGTGITLLYADMLKTWMNKKKDKETIEETAQELRGKQILKYGIPVTGGHVRYYSNHVLVYDQQKRTPVWVAEHLTEERLKGTASRKTIKFKPDPMIEEMFRSANSDYLGSGWSRGHLNPAGDNKHSQDAMAESFYLSNIVPQNYKNNAGFWNRLEMYCRDLTKKYTNVYIISGPLVMPETGENGKNFVRYEVIGENEVAVPTHLYKVVIVEDKNNRPKAYAAFVVPNTPLGYEYKLTDFQIDLSVLEKKLGVQLAPNLDVQTVDNLCKLDGCKLIERTEFELYFIGRKLDSATTLARLDKTWGELAEKKLQPDQYLKDLYQKKREEISDKTSETKT